MISSSGAGIIGGDHQYLGQNARVMDINQSSSHHTTGNFGSNVSHQVGGHQTSDPRMNKNYSQISQHSNGSNMREYQQILYMQQLMASE